MAKKFITILIISLLIHSNVLAEVSSTSVSKKPTIAVNNLDAHGITENEAATLSDVLRNKLINTGKYIVMERGEMETILKEQSFQQSGVCTDASCIVEMGQILGIEQILAGSIGKVGSAYSITVRIISVETGKIINSVSHNYTGPIEGLLTSEMSVVANKLSGIETAFTNKGSMRKKKDRKKLKRNIFITGGLLVVGGGIATVFILTGDKNRDNPTPNDPAILEVTW